MKHLLGLCTLAFFIVQPWDRLVADSIWLALSAVSFSYIVSLKIRKKNLKTPKQLKNLLWLLAIMPLLSITSYFLSPLNTLTPSLLEPDTRWLLITPIILAMRASNMNSTWVLVQLAGYALSAFAVALAQTDMTHNLHIRAEGDENAVSFGMFNATIAIMLLALLMSPYYKQFTNSTVVKLCLRTTILTVCALAIIAVALSGTRAALLLLPIAMTVLYGLYYNPKKALLGATVLISIGTLAFQLSPNSAMKEKLQHSHTNTINYFVIGDKQSKLTSMGQRLEQWKESWCIFTKHPILGTGPRSFKYGHQAYGGQSHCNATQYLEKGSYQAHSLYFNTLATLGVLGAIAMITLFAMSLKLAISTIKNRHASPESLTGALLLISVIVAHGINGLTLDLLFKNYMMDKFLLIWALSIVLIFSLNSSKLIKSEKSTV